MLLHLGMGRQLLSVEQAIVTPKALIFIVAVIQHASVVGGETDFTGETVRASYRIEFDATCRSGTDVTVLDFANDSVWSNLIENGGSKRCNCDTRPGVKVAFSWR
jgi:hypothetical protein